MKIKRFVAANMRDAIRLVREEQGPDAVILSNRRVEGGIEVVAATDYDAALIQQAVARADSGAGLAEAGPVANTSPEREPAPPLAPPVRIAGPLAARPAAVVPAQTGINEFDALKAEMASLRRFMEQQLAHLSWNDLKTRNPIRADVVRQLIGIGLELKLAREIACEVPDDLSQERARFLPMGLLSRRIPVFKHEWLDAGGAGNQVIALVGPTGVGKTTTIAKLAARYVQNWGSRDVALVTTDHFRIGAQEQLFTYGRLLGVPVLTADNQQELCQALDKLRDRKLVLIDTAGISPRDANLEKQFAMLSGLPVSNRTALVMSAASQTADLDAQFERFAPAAPSAVILTKCDEATRIGGALSAVIRHGLPLAYLADGQRVPEDLSPARADQLVLRAMQLSRKSTDIADDDEISIQFAGAAHG